MSTDLGANLAPYIEAVNGKKAEDIAILDVREMTAVADAFIICSGRSSRQVSAIGEHVLKDLRQRGIKALSAEGIRDGHWVLLDYGHVLIHVFYEPIRKFYDLESLWVRAKRIALSEDQDDPGLP
jgi:ribosome-associated protein